MFDGNKCLEETKAGKGNGEEGGATCFNRVSREGRAEKAPFKGWLEEGR